MTKQMNIVLFFLAVIAMPHFNMAMEKRKNDYSTEQAHKKHKYYVNPSEREKFYKAVANHIKGKKICLKNKEICLFPSQEDESKDFFKETDHKKYFDSQWELGRSNYHKGKFDLAKLYLIPLFTEKKRNSKSHGSVPFGLLSFMLGNIHQQQNDFDSALQMYDNAMEYDYLDAYVNVAAIYEMKKQYHTARAYLLKAIDIAIDEKTKSMIRAKLAPLRISATKEQDTFQAILSDMLPHELVSPEVPYNQ